ncbi:MAG: hypothetical protein NTY79_08550 [Chloroflexi bacterium]|nr:hypothetical protein [Chloroflexota bacterium]
MNSGINNLLYSVFFGMVPAAQQDQIIQFVFTTLGPFDFVMNGKSPEVTAAAAHFAEAAGPVNHPLSQLLGNHSIASMINLV